MNRGGLPVLMKFVFPEEIALRISGYDCGSHPMEVTSDFLSSINPSSIELEETGVGAAETNTDCN